jgi:hypothetical protein
MSGLSFFLFRNTKVDIFPQRHFSTKAKYLHIKFRHIKFLIIILFHIFNKKIYHRILFLFNFAFAKVK